MKEKLKKFWDESPSVWKLLMKFYGAVYLAVAMFALGFLIGGCGKSAPAKPEVLILRPGQSAVILENVSVLARIPAQGEELYSGPVMIERGTVAIKPLVEK